MCSEAPNPLTGVGDTVGVPCPGGGLQVGVTLKESDPPTLHCALT